jgi:glycosyltransferase involved in cell wall biosynthesis
MTSNASNMPFFHMVFLWERYWQCLASIYYDEVIVRREILMFNDYGNLFFERLMATIHNSLILDFDDDIAAAKREPRTIGFYGKLLLESAAKFTNSFKYYNGFIPASGYLKQKFLSSKNENDILVLPTCVDYDKLTPKSYGQQTWELTIGWVGARNNLENILVVIPALNALADKYKFRLLIVCDAQLQGRTNFPIENIYWSEKDEITNLQKIDIGIMPLMVNDENKGKAGFKLIQYMGCGLVSLSTALTVNTEIVEDNVNGFLVPPDADWTPYFEKVFNSRENYSAISKAAFEKVKANYSFNAHTDKLITFLKNRIN